MSLKCQVDGVDYRKEQPESHWLAYSGLAVGTAVLCGNCKGSGFYLIGNLANTLTCAECGHSAPYPKYSVEKVEGVE